MPKHKYAAGALIFGKVKGYPPWPARITGLGSKDRYKIYFYGTYETATLRSEDIWPYNPETKAKFAEKNMKKKGYPEGIDQIENTPEIAPVDGEVDMNMTAEVESPLVISEPVKKTASKAATPASKAATPASKAATPAAKTATPASKSKTKETPKVVETPKSTPARATNKRKASQASDEETPAKKASVVPAPVVKTPSADDNANNPPEQKTSRSGRALKPKKFGDEAAVGSPKAATPAAEADKENKEKIAKSPVKKESPVKPDGEPRKMWVKVKDTDDLIEINLDKDRPESFESNEAKLEWEMASARKALKFKKRVESGDFIPPEIKKKLEEKEKLSSDDRAILDKEKQLEKRKNKLRWLKIEQKLVDLDIAVKTSLHMERPMPENCISALDELNELALAPLMLKKQPDVVTTIRRLRKYIGPQDYVNWPDKSKRETMEKNIQVIQDKADQIYEKFKSFFAFQEGDKTFWEAFDAEVNEFKEKTAGLDESKILSMIRDPTKPLSNSNPLSDDDEL